MCVARCRRPSTCGLGWLEARRSHERLVFACEYVCNETQWCGIWHGRHRGGRLRGTGGAAQAWCASGHELAAAPWLASVSGEHARHREPYKLHGSTTKRTCGWRPTDDITVIVSRVIDPTEAEPARSKCTLGSAPPRLLCLLRAPGGSGQLSTPGKRSAHYASSHCLTQLLEPAASKAAHFLPPLAIQEEPPPSFSAFTGPGTPPAAITELPALKDTL